jgi:hypothetical protein
MSKISTTHDAILSNLAALYPTKSRIPNPYSLSDNNKRFLTNGYGLRVESADFQEFEFCNFVVQRVFTVVLTKEIFRLDSDTGVTDVAVKELLEDVYEVQKLFYSYNELGIEASILKVDIGSVSAIETFLGDKQNFLSMTASFNFQIRESL